VVCVAPTSVSDPECVHVCVYVTPSVASNTKGILRPPETETESLTDDPFSMATETPPPPLNTTALSLVSQSVKVWTGPHALQ
jgi:hypothetical protein